MLGNFPACNAETRKWEGGDVNHKDDPGGLTSRGVTWKAGAAHRKRLGLPPKGVTKWTDEEVTKFYITEFWQPIRGDMLPPGVDLSAYDFGVNSGVTRSAKKLQAVVGSKPDGDIGPKTLDAISARDATSIIIKLNDARLGFMRSLTIWSTFGKGWARRVAGIRAKSLEMVASSADIRDIAAEDDKKSKVEDAKAAGGGVGSAGTITAGGVDATTTPDSSIWITVALYGVGVLLILATLYFVGRAIAHRLNRDAALAVADQE